MRRKQFRGDQIVRILEVVDLLDWLFLVYGKPQHIRSDNEPELVAKQVQSWLVEQGCEAFGLNLSLDAVWLMFW